MNKENQHTQPSKPKLTKEQKKVFESYIVKFIK